MIKTLRIQLTEECNLNCVYCCHEGTKNEFSIIKNRNLESFIRAANDVLGIKRIKFTGGEPLEYDEDICKLIENVNRPEIQYSIVTNASHYDKFMSLLENFPNTEITVSLVLWSLAHLILSFVTRRECFRKLLMLLLITDVEMVVL